MTNEQLQIFLQMLADQLDAAIDAADSRLGDDVERSTHKKYIGNSLIPPILNQRNPEEWIEITDGAIALDPIREAIINLRQRAEKLTVTAGN